MARTLSSRYYTEPEIFEAELERVFLRGWQWVGRSTQVERAGDFFTCDLFGEPLIIVRGDDDALRGFYNVCRHRAGPVARDSGNCRQFQCRYHGWTYGLDGKLRRAPEMTPSPDFVPASVALAGLSVAEWGGLVFAHAGPKPAPVAVFFDGIDESMASGLRFAERREYEVAANWKAYVDNYLEGYHIPLVHPELYEIIDYECYRVETSERSSRQIAPLKSGADDQARYHWVFPNLMLNFYPGSMQVNLVLPLDVDKTLTVFEWYTASGEPSEELRAAVEFSDRVQRQDVEIVESVQMGLASRSYEGGPLSDKRENGVRHFHDLLRGVLEL